MNKQRRLVFLFFFSRLLGVYSLLLLLLLCTVCAQFLVQAPL